MNKIDPLWGTVIIFVVAGFVLAWSLVWISLDAKSAECVDVGSHPVLVCDITNETFTGGNQTYIYGHLSNCRVMKGE